MWAKLTETETYLKTKCTALFISIRKFLDPTNQPTNGHGIGSILLELSISDSDQYLVNTLHFIIELKMAFSVQKFEELDRILWLWNNIDWLFSSWNNCMLVFFAFENCCWWGRHSLIFIQSEGSKQIQICFVPWYSHYVNISVCSEIRGWALNSAGGKMVRFKIISHHDLTFEIWWFKDVSYLLVCHLACWIVNLIMHAVYTAR